MDASQPRNPERDQLRFSVHLVALITSDIYDFPYKYHNHHNRFVFFLAPDLITIQVAPIQFKRHLSLPPQGLPVFFEGALCACRCYSHWDVGIMGTEFRSVCSQVDGNSIILLTSMLLVYFVINSSTHIYLLLKIRIQ